MRLAFRTLYVVVALLAVVWGAGNIREVTADSRAVVLRFGRVDRVQEAGLLLAWPTPIEQVTMLPARDRQIEYKVEHLGIHNRWTETDVQITPNDDDVVLRAAKDAGNQDYVLTGDGSVVQFDTTLFYEISNPAAYLLSRDLVRPALRRLYLASAVAISASRDLDAFLVARPDQPAGVAEGDMVERRQALHGEMVGAINRRLADLRRQGTDLGVQVSRVDIVALLPPVAKTAFDAVLTATQIADQSAAAARTDATRNAQAADRERDRILTEAAANAEERLRLAIEETADVSALEQQITSSNRDSLITQYYREKIAGIMQKIGEVTAVDVRSGQRLLLPGPHD